MEINQKIKDFIKENISPDMYENRCLNLDKLAKKLNISEITLAKFKDDSFSGLLRKNNDNLWSIYVNETDSVKRRRFTIAHEIGHLISYLNNSYSKKGLVENGELADKAYARRNKNITNMDYEIEANAIAAEILMPKSLIKELYDEGQTAEEMADALCVSETAVAIRLYNLDIIPLEISWTR